MGCLLFCCRTWLTRATTPASCGDAALVPPDPSGGSPPSATANPINGHEWLNPKRDDLQYACTFPLPTAFQKDCSTSAASCDCQS